MLPKRAGVPLLAGLQERPRPAAIEILGDALAAAPPGDAVLTPQARQDYTDLLFCRKSPACRSATIYSGNMFVTPRSGHARRGWAMDRRTRRVAAQALVRSMEIVREAAGTGD
jgi:hypothetical protein